MKILVGVDAKRHYRSALTLLDRLKLFRPELTLLHVDEDASFPVELPHTPVFSGTGAPVGMHKGGAAILSLAVDEAHKAGFPAESIYEAGSAPHQLLLQSRQLPADLVAIGSRDRGPLASALLGSSGHKLAADSTCSVMISHGDVAPAGPVRCIFATDHSSYANEAFARFLSWGAAGIGEIIIFTALEPADRLVAASLHRTGGEYFHDARTVSAQSDELAQTLEKSGIHATTRLRTGHVAHSIDAAMKETQADLLMIGARGHGVLERIFMGSVASAVAGHASYPILILRP